MFSISEHKSVFFSFDEQKLKIYTRICWKDIYFFTFLLLFSRLRYMKNFYWRGLKDINRQRYSEMPPFRIFPFFCHFSIKSILEFLQFILFFILIFLWFLTFCTLCMFLSIYRVGKFKLTNLNFWNDLIQGFVWKQILSTKIVCKCSIDIFF